MKKILIMGVAAVAVGFLLWMGLRNVTTAEYAEDTERESPSEPSPKVLATEEADGWNESAESVQSVEDQSPVYAADKLSGPVKALLGLDGQERNYSELLTWGVRVTSQYSTLTGG
jgi:hypothetical protein